MVRSPVTDLKAIKNEVEVEGMCPVLGAGRESRVELAGNQGSGNRTSGMALRSSGTSRG